MIKRLNSKYCRLLVAGFMLGFTACENNNLFSKLHGDSSDPQVLSEQAAIALKDRDYSKALSLYNQVLAQNPTDSVALNGAAAAELGMSGLSFSTLLSNVLENTTGASSLSVRGLSDAIALGREHVTSFVNCGGADSILGGVDCDTLNGVIDRVICRWQTIAAGGATGEITSNDTALLIDFGILCVLRAALRALRGNFLDITNNGGTFSISAGSQLSNLCNSTNKETAKNIVKDVAGAYALFNRVVTLRNLSGNPIVIQIRNDVEVVGNKIMQQGSGQILPQACFDNVFTELGITQANYLSVLQNGPFTAPGSC